MKQVVVIGPAHPLRGGIAAYTQRLAQEFVKEGHQTTVFTFSLQYPSFLFPGKTQYSSDPPPAGLTIYKVINSVNPFNWWKTGNKIKRLKPDIVVFNYWLPFMSPCFGTIARRIRKNRHSSIIAVIHNMLPHEKRLGDKVLSRYFVKACDGFLTMTKKVEQDLSTFTATSRITTPHPVYDSYGNAVSREEALQHLKLDAAHHYVLFFGLVRRYKGLDLLMEAMADERVRRAGARLIVAGEFYDDRNYYDELLRKAGIYNEVVMVTDYIPDEEVKYYFSAADLVVLPYRNATQSGVSALAIHFDKPMIVSNFGGLPDVVHHGETGYVTDADAKAVADAIVRYYTATDREKMKEMVKKEKSKYSWSNVVRGIVELSNGKKA